MWYDGYIQTNQCSLKGAGIMAHQDSKRTPQRKARDAERKARRAAKFFEARAARAAMIGGIK